MASHLAVSSRATPRATHLPRYHHRHSLAFTALPRQPANGTSGQGLVIRALDGGDSYLHLWSRAVDREKKEIEFQKLADNLAGVGADDDNKEVKGREEVEKKSQEFKKILEVSKEERDRIQRLQVIDRAAAAISAARAILGESKAPAEDEGLSDLNSDNGSATGARQGGTWYREVFVPQSEASPTGVPGPDFWSWTPPQQGDRISDDDSILQPAKKSSVYPTLTNHLMEKERSADSLSIPFESKLYDINRSATLPPFQSLTEVERKEVSDRNLETPSMNDEHDLNVLFAEHAAEVAHALDKLDESSYGVNPDGSRWWKQTRPSSTSYGGAYTAALSQLVFSAIAQAASDSLAIFDREPAYISELVMWATKQTEAFALLVKRHALASSAAAGGLRAAAECVQIALGHCSLLEGRGLALCPVLLKLFRPSVEQALDANLKRIEESTAALAAADDWVLTYSPTGTRHSSTAFQHKLTSSAHRFNLMVQDFFEDVGPLLSMQLGGQTLEGLFQVFNSYVNVLIKALPGSMDEEANFEGSGNKIVQMAETEAQQIALLANASLLADELLPRAAMKLAPLNQSNYKGDNRRRPTDRQNRHPEQREWKRRLVGSVDRLKDTFCRQHALDLIFTEDGDSHLSADMYINMDGNADDVEWFPSLIFQELYVKLNRIASLAADMFVGRERFATLLLMRLTETVILWLSEDQSFWDDIEDGPRPLGPLGLQQFYLDMKFVICFASQGRYLSRNLHRVVNEIISKAMGAYAATGMDPYSELPEDDWFNEVCQEAMERLSGKPKAINGDRDPNSPTASVSAQSISSVRSLGST